METCTDRVVDIQMVRQWFREIESGERGVLRDFPTRPQPGAIIFYKIHSEYPFRYLDDGYGKWESGGTHDYAGIVLRRRHIFAEDKPSSVKDKKGVSRKKVLSKKLFFANGHVVACYQAGEAVEKLQLHHKEGKRYEFMKQTSSEVMTEIKRLCRTMSNAEVKMKVPEARNMAQIKNAKFRQERKPNGNSRSTTASSSVTKTASQEIPIGDCRNEEVRASFSEIPQSNCLDVDVSMHQAENWVDPLVAQNMEVDGMTTEDSNFVDLITTEGQENTLSKGGNEDGTMVELEILREDNTCTFYIPTDFLDFGHVTLMEGMQMDIQESVVAIKECNVSQLDVVESVAADICESATSDASKLDLVETVAADICESANSDVHCGTSAIASTSDSTYPTENSVATEKIEDFLLAGSWSPNRNPLPNVDELMDKIITHLSKSAVSLHLLPSSFFTKMYYGDECKGYTCVLRPASRSSVLFLRLEAAGHHMLAVFVPTVSSIYLFNPLHPLITCPDGFIDYIFPSLIAIGSCLSAHHHWQISSWRCVFASDGPRSNTSQTLKSHEDEFVPALTMLALVCRLTIPEDITTEAYKGRLFRMVNETEPKRVGLRDAFTDQEINFKKFKPSCPSPNNCWLKKPAIEEIQRVLHLPNVPHGLEHLPADFKQ